MTSLHHCARPRDLLTRKVALTLPALILLSPLLAVLALLVCVKLGAPVFFRQPRPGLHGRAFRRVKFRTMTDERDAQGNLLPDAQRLTRFRQVLARCQPGRRLPVLRTVVQA